MYSQIAKPITTALSQVTMRGIVCILPCRFDKTNFRGSFSPQKVFNAKPRKSTGTHNSHPTVGPWRQSILSTTTPMQLFIARLAKLRFDIGPQYCRYNLQFAYMGSPFISANALAPDTDTDTSRGAGDQSSKMLFLHSLKMALI